jgi:hypothetical protein
MADWWLAVAADATRQADQRPTRHGHRRPPRVPDRPQLGQRAAESTKLKIRGRSTLTANVCGQRTSRCPCTAPHADILQACLHLASDDHLSLQPKRCASVMAEGRPVQDAGAHR